MPIGKPKKPYRRGVGAIAAAAALLLPLLPPAAWAKKGLSNAERGIGQYAVIDCVGPDGSRPRDCVDALKSLDEAIGRDPALTQALAGRTDPDDRGASLDGSD